MAGIMPRAAGPATATRETELSDELADHQEADQFYRTVDTFIRLLGAEQVSRTELFFRLSRAAIGAQLDHSELQRIVARISSFHAWYDAWRDAAERFRLLGEAAEAAGHRTSAGEHLLRAALLYHFAQLFTRPEDARRREGQAQRVALYRRAAPHLSPAVALVRVPCGRAHCGVDSLPGYLRLPAGKGPHPLAIQVPGANSVKEELHHWGSALLARGIAVLAIDGPGQGELSVKNGGAPLRLERFPAVVSSVFDWLATQTDVDASRIALWGQSTGGNLALLAAAEEPRVRALVTLSGGYDFRRKSSPSAPVDVREEARDLYGMATFSELRGYIRAHGSLDGKLGRIRCPILLVHGGQDPLVEREEVELIRREAGGTVDVHEYPDGGHSLCNRNMDMVPAMADWLAATLR